MLLSLSLSSVLACTEPTPIPGPLCGDPARPEFCKTTCGADALCPGGNQERCELDCRACVVDRDYCPMEEP
ncbi:MAG: hypothetical protein IPL61_37605 [Myxococcales bacterium]|nr:hypothetical protein [Myxococcales bacterium]